jgi:ribosomal protein S18 acetylase RimI-like enzyme
MMPQTIHANTIRTLEEVSLRAWPALQTRYYDGWVLRMAKGYTRRANSVNPVFGSSLAIDEKIDFCEALYFGQHNDIRFKMTDAVYPVDLDDRLAARDYEKEPATSVQTLDLLDMATDISENVDISPHLTAIWLEDFVRLSRADTRLAPTMRHIFGKILPETGFLQLRHHDETVAVALGVLDENRLGIFDVVTSIDQRRQGFGETVVRNLLAWGAGKGATTAYLQVMSDNDHALRLYDKIGFREAYCYWYRRARSTK